VEEEELVAHALELPAKVPAPVAVPEDRNGGASVPVVGGPPAGTPLATADKGSPVSD
jgi:hypothetical protein